MSYVRFNISDRTTTIHGDLHGSMTDPLIATLTAEPETLEEFETALHRYVKSESDWPPLHTFRKGEDLEPYDAGIVAIDLASRTVGYESTYSYPSSEGEVRVPSEFADDPKEELHVPYRLPDDWRFIKSIPMYEGTSARRRDERVLNAPFDARPILFGRPMITHIVKSVAESPDLAREELFSDIHANWLMTKRRDLRDRSPREVLLEKQDFIDFDLHTRSLQWSFTKVCPPGLGKDSFAYQNAGFGTHEWVLYYELFRHLLADAIEHYCCGGVADAEAEIGRLSGVRDRWLRSPDSESWGRLPIEMIDLERRRVNMTMSAKELLIDENCPCCVAMAEDFDTPAFWHLDGCNMDDRFEFSQFKTLEEYEDDIRRREEFNREFERKYRENPEAKWYGDDPENPF